MHLSIKNFNNNLNKSVIDQYDLWKDYRKHITNIIESNIKVSDRIIIIGAGMCSDLDLKKILKSCSHITLVDVDEESIERGIKRQGISTCCNDIKMIQADVTGLEGRGFIKQFYNLIKDNRSIGDVNSFLDKHLSDIEIPTELTLLLEQYDVVITMPIYTQLIFTQIMFILKELENRQHLSDYYLESIQEEVLEFMPKIIRNYNNLLQSLCYKSGLLIVFSDLIEAHPEHEMMIKIKGLINNNDSIDLFLRKYTDQYGYGLGTYGVMHLSECVNTIDQHYLVWPFTKNREFLVGGVICNFK